LALGLMGFLTMLAGEGPLGKRRICTVMGHLGIKVSLGALCHLHRLAATLLQKPFEGNQASGAGGQERQC